MNSVSIRLVLYFILTKVAIRGGILEKQRDKNDIGIIRMFYSSYNFDKQFLKKYMDQQHPSGIPRSMKVLYLLYYRPKISKTSRF